VAEEQPQQNDHRNRHTKQPEQKSSFHCSLLENLLDSKTQKGMSGSAVSDFKCRSCPLSKKTRPMGIIERATHTGAKRGASRFA
jgi:hypothetical protein